MIKESFKVYKDADERWKISIASVILSIISIIIFLRIIYYFYKLGGNFTIDKWAIDYILSVQNGQLDIFFKAITFIGNPSTIIFFTTIIFYIFYNNKLLKDGIYFITNIIGVWLFNELLKVIFRRERPIIRIMEVRGYSMPSGHAMIFTAFSLICIYFILIKFKVTTSIKIGIFLIVLLSIAVGLSRVYLRVHFLSDVIAGWCAGALWAGVSAIVHRYIYYRSKLKEVKN